MRINNNIMSLNAHRQLGINQGNGAKSMERLSSGLRINRAGDDAAGLAISEKMRGQIRGLNQATRNAQDGISLIQTAEGALNETHSILQRMRELAAQAANDTNTEIDRGEIQKEINELTSEINRIGNTTEFNTMKLLDGSRSASSQITSTDVVDEADISVAYANVTFSGGMTASNLPSVMNGENGYEIGLEAGDFMDLVDADEGASITISRVADGLRVELASTDGTESFSSDDTLVAAEDGSFTYDAHGVSFSISADEFAKMEVGHSFSVAVEDSADTEVAVLNRWTSNEVADPSADDRAEISNFNTTSADMLDGAYSVTANWDGTDVTVTILDANGEALSTDVYEVFDPTGTFSYDNHGIAFDMDINDATEAAFTHVFATDDSISEENNALAFQIGANEAQALNLSISDMRSVALGISSTTAGAGFVDDLSVTDGTDAALAEYSLDVSSHQSAAQALTTIDSAIEKVSAERSMLGATQNRLEHTISNLGTSSENLQAAESRIRDLDMAQEMMSFTKNNILQQAATAMLAQANMAPQSVLQLLG